MSILLITRFVHYRPKPNFRNIAEYGTNLKSTIFAPRRALTKEWKVILKKKSYSVIADSSLKFSSEAPSINSNKWIGRWLFGCSGMVFGAVILGGLTRLTESGLSMTDWNLLGKQPPLNEEQWQREFDQYKEYPEFKLKNNDISLAEFKFIFYMEYFHRQWGRAIGIFFLLPATYFLSKGLFTTALKKRMALCGSLILLQGLMGWYMVKSGLDEKNFKEPSDVPRVSQYRLMSHLGAAFVLYTLFLWNALAVTFPAIQLEQVSGSMTKFRKFAHVTKGWIFFTALSGALVAGLDAGLVYNSFPKMADRWIPSDILSFSPTLRNFTENPTTVQFDHRILGTASLVLATAIGLWSRKLKLPPRAHTAATALASMAWIQVGLGISTLLFYVPTWLAALHQSGSLITLSFAVWLTHELKFLKKIPK